MNSNDLENIQFSELVTACNKKRAELLIEARKRGACNRDDGIALENGDDEFQRLFGPLELQQKAIRAALQTIAKYYYQSDPSGDPMSVVMIEALAAASPWWQGLPWNQGADIYDLGDFAQLLQRRYQVPRAYILSKAGISEDTLEAIECGNLAAPPEYWQALEAACAESGPFGVDSVGRAYLAQFKTLAKRYKGVVPHGPI